MKKSVRLIALALMLAMLLPTLFSCNNNKPAVSDGTTDSTADSSTSVGTDGGEVLEIIKDGVVRFTIVRPDDEATYFFEKNAAISLNNAFRAACGKFSSITTDWERNAVKESEICIGNLTRNGKYYNIDPDSLSADEFIVKAVDGRIVLLGKTSSGTKKAVDWFIATYLSATDASLKNLSIPADFSYIGKFDLPAEITIMTQNLLATDTEYPDYVKNNPSYAARITVDLAKHTIEARQPRILSLISTYQPDSLGVQECSDPWRKYFDSTLAKIGYRRIGASKNQKIGIIYNTGTVKAVANGSIWLTENPESLKISKEWNGSSERLAMYVVFEVLATGERYIHFNTHLATNEANNIQTRQTEVLLNYIESIRKKYDNIPAVVTGDFNFQMNDAPYPTLVSSFLGDTRSLAQKASGAGSFNKFIGKDYASLPIDQIMITKENVTVLEYKVIYDVFDGCYASDHYAVKAEIILEK